MRAATLGAHAAVALAIASADSALWRGCAAKCSNSPLPSAVCVWGLPVRTAAGK
jgi:hypothetical protein